MTRELEPWGGDVHMPRWLRWMLRRKEFADTPERARERSREGLHPAPPDVTVLENADRAIFGGFSEGHPGNREQPRGR